MTSEILQYSNIGPEAGHSLRAALLALSVGMLGTTLQITDGLYSPAGIVVLTLSLTLCLLAVLGPLGAVRNSLPINKLKTFMGLLVAVQLLEMLITRSGASEVTVPQVGHNFFNSCVLVAIVGLTLILFGQSRAALKGFVLMLMMFAIMGIWKIRTAPAPLIDVFIFHRDAADALAHGQNPYSITFPDIYGPKGNWVYGQGVASDGRLQFGYPYPPLILLLTAGAKLALGDARYAMLLAMLVSGVAIYLIQPGRIGMLAAALLLFTPRSFYVLESAWTEPLSVMLLTMAIFLMTRWPVAAPVLFGLLIASKQYLPAAVLLLPILLTRFDWKLAKFLIVAMVTALVVTLPFALWDFKAFWDSVVALQLRQPYRADSLGYLAWWGFRRAGWQGPFWLCFVALMVAMVLCYIRVRPGITGFANSMALCFFAFFAFNKQAFANYYYLVLGAMCCAIVAGANFSKATSQPINSGSAAENGQGDYRQ